MVIHKKGNAVSALIDGEIDMLVHVCNNKSSMGSGIALEIKNRIPDAFRVYKKSSCKLGEVTHGWYFETLVPAKGFVCNMVAQDGYGQGIRHLNYGALADCLSQVREINKGVSLRIGLPYKMGADRAGGDWNIVLEMVEFFLKDFTVIVYELEN